MRKFITTLRRDDRGDQLVGWVMLVSFIVIVGAAVWGGISDNITEILTGVDTVTGEAAANIQ